MKKLRVICLSILFILNVSSALANDKSLSVEKAKPSVKKQPNVLIIMFDDMRFDSFSYRGGPVNTPNIDALAAQSTRFDNAMSTTGLCSPSRAAFFTGRWGHKNGLDDNVELYHSRQYQLDPSEGGLLKRASDQKYLVGYVGKWHIGPQGPKIRGAEFIKGTADTRVRKPRHFVAYEDRDAIENYKLGKLDKNNEKHVYYKTLDGTYEDTESVKKLRYAQKMLHYAADENRPFFGVVSFNQPHPPYRVPEPYASMYEPTKINVPVNHAIKRVNKPITQDGILWPWHDVSHMSDMDWRKSRAFYYGAISMVDDIVGELIQTAKNTGLYDDLHIVLVGDQGSMIGEHSLYDKGPYAYDELMRIPLLIRIPNIAPRIVNRQVSLIDVAPTLAEVMSLPNDGDVDGRSLVQLMKKGDKADGNKPDIALYAYEWYNGSWYGIRAIRTPEYKFVWYPGDSKDELYDLTNDPAEITNLIDNKKHAKALAQLNHLLEEELIRTNDPALTIYKHHKKAILQ